MRSVARNRAYRWTITGATLLVALIAGCGSSSQEASNALTTTSTVGSDSSDSTDGEEQMDDQWIRIETDPAVSQYQSVRPLQVIPHPNDPQAILVQFVMPHPPCSGAKVKLAETDDSISVDLLVGLHENVAAMTCLAGEGQYELKVKLGAPFAKRSIQVVVLPDSYSQESQPQALESAGAAPTTSSTAPEVTQPPSSQTVSSTSPNTEINPDINTDGLIGMTIEEASAAAIDRGLTLRVMRQDGEDLMGTADFRPNRVNVEVTEGRVTAILNLG